MIKKYKVWYYILISVGILGLVDIFTAGIVQQTTGLASELGLLSIGALELFTYVFGQSTLSVYSTIIISGILKFSVFWLALGYLIKKKRDYIKDPSDANLKKVKRAKLIPYFFCILILAAILFSVFMTSIN